MDGLVFLQRAVIVLSNLVTLSVASGLIFAALVQPRRDRSSLLFAFFSLSVALWSLFSLASFVPELRFGVSLQMLASLSSTAIALTGLSYFLFVVRFACNVVGFQRTLADIAPLLVPVSLVLVWSGAAFTATGDAGPPTLTGVGYGLVALLVAYTAFALWVIVRSPEEQAFYLRIPSLVLVLAFISTGIEALNQASVDTLLATGVVVWTGWIMLQRQLYKPLDDLSAELRTANRDLSQTLSELADQRAIRQRLQDDLNSAGGYKSTFFTGMSHKLRTPLNSIVGYSELLQSGTYGDLNEKQGDRVEKIHRNGRALLDLMNQMFDLGTIEAGGLELQPSVFHVETVIQDVIAPLNASGGKQDVVVHAIIAPELMPLYGDAQRIQQVVAQLVDNALKFTTAGEVIIKAETIRVAQGVAAMFTLPFKGWLADGEWMIVSVKDSGIGIAPEDQARIFDEFYQATSERAASEFMGTGLGLTICKRLIAMHDGVIWVRSQPGEGSTFYVALPHSRDGARVRRTGSLPAMTTAG